LHARRDAKQGHEIFTARHARVVISSPLQPRLCWQPNAIQETAMKISARNVLTGRIVDIKKGATTAHVLLDVNGTTITASITNESVDDLKLTVGQQAYAVIKSPDVMIGID
jgi:molybdopterin-binding protein